MPALACCSLGGGPFFTGVAHVITAICNLQNSKLRTDHTTAPWGDNPCPPLSHQHWWLLFCVQVALLKELRPEKLASTLEISTVDGFQGREKEAIVISMVRRWVPLQESAGVPPVRGKFCIQHWHSLQGTLEGMWGMLALRVRACGLVRELLRLFQMLCAGWYGPTHQPSQYSWWLVPFSARHTQRRMLHAHCAMCVHVL